MRTFKLAALSAALLGLAATAPAHAVSFITTDGSIAVFNSSDDLLNPGDKVVTFDGPDPAGITVTHSGSAVVSGSVGGSYAQPAYSDGSNYLAVYGGTNALIRDSDPLGYNALSLFLGSIDTYNTIEILDVFGSVIDSFVGSAFAVGDGNQTLPQTNRLITFSREAGDLAIGGVRILSSQNSAEVDNVRFLSAVPEPGTWAMMLLGFLAVGYSLRRRRNVRVSFA